MKTVEGIASALEGDRRKSFGLAFSAFVFVAVVDLLTPEQFSFSLFYLFPISLFLWFVDNGWEWACAGASALLWAANHLAHGDRAYFQTLVPYWEAASRFGFYSVFIVALATIRRYLGQLRAMNNDLRNALAVQRESEQRYREVFEHSPSGILLLDVTPENRFVITTANPAVEYMTGISAAAAAGRPIDDVLPRAAAEELSANYRRCVKEGVPITVGGSVDLPAGHVTFRTTLIPLREASGRIHRLIALPIDLTASNAAEEARREMEQRYREVFENTSDGIFVIDVTPERRFRVVAFNPAMERMVGLSNAEVAGKYNEEFLPPETAAAVTSNNERSLQAGTPISFEEQLDLPGGRFTWNTTLVPVRDAPGRICRLIGVARDITERVRAEEREKEHERQLFQAAKLSSLGTLVAGIAHEINNPNNYIRLNSQNLQEFWLDIRRILDQDAAREHDLAIRGIPYGSARAMFEDLVAGIGEGSKRIEKLLANLRDFARGDEGELTEDVDVNAVIESAVMITRELIQKSTTSFTVVKWPDLPSVRGNYHQIEQVIINLLTNACQALPSRDRKVTVTTAVADGRDSVVLEVADEGVGMPPQNVSRVTDPFFTTKRAKGGSGLGLAVSSRIISNHKGRITFDSRVDRGTRVTVLLPAAGSPPQIR